MTARLYDSRLSAASRAYRENASTSVVARLIASAIETAIEDATRFDQRLDPSVREALTAVLARYSEDG